MVDMGRRGNIRRGFSLVELLVAMAITAIVSVAILTLMDSTSDSMRMAESSSNALDRNRFAIERVRSFLRNAGAYASPDTRDDPKFQPPPHEQRTVNNSSCGISGANTNARRIAGLVSYNGGYTEESGKAVNGGWQDYAQDIMGSDLYDANAGDKSTGYINSVSSNGAYAPEFDGIIVVGAYDFPLPVQVTNVSPDNGYDGCSRSEALVPASQRGTYQLANPDPFEMSASTTSLPGEVETMLSDSENQRALRIMDHNGYFQLARICHSKVTSGDKLQLGFSDLLDYRSNADSPGMDPCSQQTDDITYRAALLDAYWLRVRQDPNDSKNFQLVRNRLDASALAAALSQNANAEMTWGGLNPWTLAIDPDSPTVIADQVVDFNIWFDCADDSGTSGAIDDVAWQGTWPVPDGEGSPGTASEEPTNCMNPADPDPARLRAAHVRLSMRTSGERSALAHVPFQAGGERMQTYDLHPGSKGAARVITSQMDFELPSFAARNIVSTSSP